MPTVTVPFSYYDDGTPFVVAFIGDMWSEAELLGFAHAFESDIWRFFLQLNYSSNWIAFQAF